MHFFEVVLIDAPETFSATTHQDTYSGKSNVVAGKVKASYWERCSQWRGGHIHHLVTGCSLRRIHTVQERMWCLFSTMVLRNALGVMGNQSSSGVFLLLGRVIFCVSKSIILMIHLQTYSLRLPLSKLQLWLLSCSLLLCPLSCLRALNCERSGECQN